MRINDKNGLTLIELVIVLLIMGIMAAIAAPSFLSLRPNMHLKAAARDLYSNMQKARIEAVKTNRNTAIIFDTGSGKYEICNDWDNADTSTTPPSCGGLIIDFSSMKSGVGYGHGSATSPVGSTFSDNVSYYLPLPANVVIFNSQGIGKSGYVYLDHQHQSVTTAYAVGSTTSGVIKLLKWQGNNWK